MAVFDLVRDSFFWAMKEASDASGETINPNNAPGVRFGLSGAVQLASAEFRVSTAVSIQANNHRSVGVLITGPDGVANTAEERVPYRVKGYAHTNFGGVTPTFGLGIGPASPDGTSTFSLDNYAFFGKYTGMSDTMCAYVDDIIFVPPFGTIGGTDYSARSLAFFVRYLNSSAAAQTARLEASCMIQRLDVQSVHLRDRRRP